MTLKSVEQAAAVLYLITDEARPYGVREMSRSLGVSKSTMHRILDTLVQCQLLSFEEAQQKYEVGPGLARIARGALGRDALVETARPVMSALAESSGETVALSVLLDDARVPIFQLESSQGLRFTTQVGHRYPIVRGATGRVLLAQLDEDESTALLDRVEEAGEADAEARQRAQQAAQVVREEGYSTSFGEWVSGGAALSVPVPTRGGPPAALSVYVPEVRLPPERATELLKHLKEAGSLISDRL